MIMNENQIEQEIQAKGLNAPRLTPDHIESVISSEWYINGATGVVHDGFQPPVGVSSPLNQLTICVLVLKNGFMVTGTSACASPENFDVEIGRKIARDNAKQKIWELEGYLLKQNLCNTAPEPFPVIDSASVQTLEQSEAALG